MEESIKLSISIRLWFQLIRKLRKSGIGSRESGAVLLGKYNSNRVLLCISLEEFDPNCLTNGFISFHSNGYVKLWKYCKENNLVVLADVHTHPSSWISQSTTDIRNPFISILGHVAIIVPNYALSRFQLKTGVGIYEYGGKFEWTKLQNNKIKFTVL